MSRRSVILRWTLITVLVFIWPLQPAFNQTAPAKKPISYDVYDGWRSIQGTQLSRDGTWLAYALVPQDGDGELVVRNHKLNKEYRAPRGKEPVITVDGKFVVFTIAPLKADMDKAKKDKKKPEEQPKNNLGIMNLANGEVATVERIKSFKVPEESGVFIAYLMEPPLKKADEKAAEEKKEEEKKEAAKKEPEKKEGEKKEEPKKKEKKIEPGNDLIIRELATGKTATVSEVVEYSWPKNGTWLAYGVASKKPEENSACIRRASDGTTKTLLKGQGHYKSFAFDEKGTQMAFLSDRDDYKADAPAFKLYGWTEPGIAAVELASAATKGMPQGMTVSENGKPEFSKAGGRLFFGIAPAPKAEPEDAPEPVKVDIWNWKDPFLQTMQKARAEEDKKRTYWALIHLREKKFVPLASPDMPGVEVSEDSKDAPLILGTSDVPYRQLVSWDQSYSDYYLVNAIDGSRKKIIEKCPSSASFSPGRNYLLYYEESDRSWRTFRVLDGKVFNLTAKLGARFENEEHDTPDDPRPYGTAGWTDGDRAVLLYDRFDIWEVKPDGSGGRMVTNGTGRKNGLVFRYVRLDREQKTIPVKEPILLATTDDRTKASGYFRVSLASNADPSKLIMLDKSFRSLVKAKNADTYVFSLERFDEFRDLWVSGPTFADMTKVSDANPQQAGYVWGKAELIDYINADGKTLDAILIKPDDFDPAKRYPLMVYIYERLSGNLHSYTPPSPGTGINFSRYVSNGYVILLPDIVYDTGYPGPSAVKCVLPAVEKVLGLGFIDPKRIGIAGHSWGGYQISYLITQCNIFAAVEAGASVVNMTSAYGGIRWGTGMSRAFQYEKTQSRIGAPLWTRALQFLENSPLFWVERVQTPYLTIHNDEDDAVPWYQGIEFFSALRHLGKEAYMFNFNGEKHGLRERENQKYWTIHLDEFFDHFLLGKPRPDWMEKGVPYLERGKRDINSFYKKAEKKEEKKEAQSPA